MGDNANGSPKTPVNAPAGSGWYSSNNTPVWAGGGKVQQNHLGKDPITGEPGSWGENSWQPSNPWKNDYDPSKKGYDFGTGYNPTPTGGPEASASWNPTPAGGGVPGGLPTPGYVNSGALPTGNYVTPVGPGMNYGSFIQQNLAGQGAANTAEFDAMNPTRQQFWKDNGWTDPNFIANRPSEIDAYKAAKTAYGDGFDYGTWKDAWTQQTDPTAFAGEQAHDQKADYYQQKARFDARAKMATQLALAKAPRRQANGWVDPNLPVPLAAAPAPAPWVGQGRHLQRKGLVGDWSNPLMPIGPYIKPLV